MSRYHEKPDVSPKLVHSSIDRNNRYTIEFGERKRIKETLSTAGVRNKKKHKLRQKRAALEKSKEYYGDRYNEEIDTAVKQSLNEMLNRNYKETSDENN